MQDSDSNGSGLSITKKVFEFASILNFEFEMIVVIILFFSCCYLSVNVYTLYTNTKFIFTLFRKVLIINKKKLKTEDNK